jgi:hypothetical protein
MKDVVQGSGSFDRFVEVWLIRLDYQDGEEEP